MVSEFPLLFQAVSNHWSDYAVVRNYYYYVFIDGMRVIIVGMSSALNRLSAAGYFSKPLGFG